MGRGPESRGRHGSGPAGGSPSGPYGGASRSAGISGAHGAGSQPTRVVGGTAETAAVKKVDLTVNKIIASAGAAATTAVFGSFFGATGTVVGAALGSVVTTVGTTIYQRSLDRTRDTVLQRIKVPGTGETVIAETVVHPADAMPTIPLQRGTTPDGRTMLEPATAEPARPRVTRKRLIIAGISTVVAFVTAMLLITGIEWIKGSPISGGDSGTSVSRVVSGTADTSGDQQSGSTDTTGSSAPTTSETPSPGVRDGSGDSTRDANPSGTTTTTPRSGGSTSTPATGTTTAPNGGLGGLLGGNGSGGESPQQ
ncbi:hypothetical protein [Pseudonocardia ailaonensis]|uniref:hypothetical protein n=1 Tax=Pseudonocardia ailaonensis TaxID=367279 RepID=UPI0031D4B047